MARPQPEEVRGGRIGAVVVLTVTYRRQDQGEAAERREDTKQGLGKKEIMCCLKRNLVREVHAALLTATSPLLPLDIDRSIISRISR